MDAPLPEFLARAFPVASLVKSSDTLAALSPGGELLWVNPAWHSFAKANGGTELLQRFRPGHSYFDGISPPLRDYYESVFGNALATGEVFEQDYECSSPEQYRLHHLRVLPFGKAGLLVEHSLLVDRPHQHPELAGLEAHYRSPSGLILQCSNCRRFRRADAAVWDWVRVWISQMPRDVTHGLCAACVGFYWGARSRSRT